MVSEYIIPDAFRASMPPPSCPATPCTGTPPRRAPPPRRTARSSPYPHCNLEATAGSRFSKLLQVPVCRKGAEIETRKKREERREKREEEVLPTSEPSLNPKLLPCVRVKKIHLISEKLVLAVAKERFERTISSGEQRTTSKLHEASSVPGNRADGVRPKLRRLGEGGVAT